MAAANQPQRTLLLTGASRGIGHATVKRFSAAGWRVITCSRHPFPENCPWEMGPEDHIQVDLASPASTQEAIAEIKKRLAHGELHALVNNAAISPKAEGGARIGTIDTTLDTWEHVFHVNFFAPIMLARGLVDELKATKGSVVNVTSIAGSRVHPFAGAAYATSKAALAALTREMAFDFGPLGVRVNAINPGSIVTERLKLRLRTLAAEQGLEEAEAARAMTRASRVARFGDPTEIARAVAFLASPQASYVQGALLDIDGGQTRTL